MFSSLKLLVAAIAVALIGGASASPLQSRSCYPNFQGNDVRITNRFNPAFPMPNHAYQIEYSGQPDNSYLIKLADNHDKVVAAVSGMSSSLLHTVDINWAYSDPLQLWRVWCDECGDPSTPGQLPRGCHIQLWPKDLCVRLLGGSLRLARCYAGATSEKYDFEPA